MNAERRIYRMKMFTNYLDKPIGLDSPIVTLSWCDLPFAQKAYHVELSGLADADCRLYDSVWDSGWITSCNGMKVICQADLKPDTRYSWKLSVRGDGGQTIEGVDFFTTGMRGSEWPAQWVSAKENLDEPDVNTSPLLRGILTVKEGLLRATAFVYTNCFYQMYIGGERVGCSAYMPGMPGRPGKDEPARCLPYDTYDITTLLLSGTRTVGLWLGDGENETFNEWGWRYTGAKKAIVLLRLHYADGSTVSWGTDKNWCFLPESPIRHNGVYAGEWYDALQETDWMNPDFLEGWQPVYVVSPIPTPLISDSVPPIKQMEELYPQRRWKTQRGTWILDMGQNFSGVCRITLYGAVKAQHITLKHAEDISENMELDLYTNRHAHAEDHYIAKGDEVEVYTPRFTWHGFRYVEVENHPSIHTHDAVVGLCYHAAVRRTGRILTDDTRLNRVMKNIMWGIRSNLASHPSDCPCRDERTPCQMDSCVTEEAAIHLFDMHAYYSRWLNNILGDVRSPDWGGDQVTLCRHLYWYYGDTAIVRKSYPYIRAYLKRWLGQRDEQGLIAEEYGDWTAPSTGGSFSESFRDVREVNTALMIRLLDIGEEFATLMEEKSDAEHFRKEASIMRQAFVRAFYHDSQGCFGESLTPNALAVCYHIGSSREREKAKRFLRETLLACPTMRVGIFGNRYLPEAMLMAGESDLILKALTNEDYPSFGWQIDHGATTLWEQWQIHGGMESHNHAMYAGACTPLFTYLAGIRPLKPGYSEVEIMPLIPDSLNLLDVSIQTPMGEMSVSWSKEGIWLTMEVRSPFNTVMSISLPNGDKHRYSGGSYTFRILLADIRKQKEENHEY